LECEPSTGGRGNSGDGGGMYSRSNSSDSFDDEESRKRNDGDDDVVFLICDPIITGYAQRARHAGARA
jgi:hypothetical protein